MSRFQSVEGWENTFMLSQPSIYFKSQAFPAYRPGVRPRPLPDDNISSPFEGRKEHQDVAVFYDGIQIFGLPQQVVVQRDVDASG